MLLKVLGLPDFYICIPTIWLICNHLPYCSCLATFRLDYQGLLKVQLLIVFSYLALIHIQTFSLFIIIRPTPGLLPVLGPLERYMAPTLDATLLSSSWAGADLGHTAMLLLNINSN